MIPLLAGLPPATLEVTLGTCFVGVGAWCAWRHHRLGRPTPTVLAALVAWPLLWPDADARPLPSPGNEPGNEPAAGPLRPRIDEAFAALERALVAPGADAVARPGDLIALRTALRQIDARVAAVDRLLEDTLVDRLPDDPAISATLDRLHRARARAVAALEDSLAGLARLRLQVGLVALAGDVGPVREHLLALAARVAALDEVTGLEGVGA